MTHAPVDHAASSAREEVRGRSASAWAGVILLALGILYGSWIPFDLNLDRANLVLQRTIPPLGFPHGVAV